MQKFSKYFKEIGIIAAPIVAGNLGHVLIGATDVFVAAKHSVDTLSAVAIANSVFFTVFIIGLGILNGVSIVLSNYRGERKETKKYFVISVILSQILAAITVGILLLITYCIPYIGFEEKLVPLIQQYMYITSFSVFGIYLYQSIKEFLQAHEIVLFPNLILIVMVFVNLILNFVLVFGFGNIPAYGITGLSVATLIVRTLLGIILIIYTRKVIFDYINRQIYFGQFVRQVFKNGFPIGIGLLLEFLGFNMITVFVGLKSGILAGINNLIFTIIDITFMIPFAISSAIAIKVGYYNGAKNFDEIKNYGRAGLLLSAMFVLFYSVIYLTVPEHIIGIFTHDKEIVRIALPIVTLLALFEIADGIQISLSGILKGLKLTKQATLCTIASYWGIGIPLGFYLDYAFDMSLMGFWSGLTVALIIVAILEYIVIIRKYREFKQ